MASSEGVARSESNESGNAQDRLIAIGTSKPREYLLDKPTIAIGTHSSNDVVLDDTTVSRRHATITRKLGRFQIADLGSTNGTFVNGVRVRTPTTLKRGDEIKFGSARLAFMAALDSTPAPSRRGLRFKTVTAIALVMFALGFVGVRYRDQIVPAVSTLAARIASRKANPQPQPSVEPSVSTSAGTEVPAAESKAKPETSARAETGSSTGAGAPEWLKRLNYYRAMVKLPPVVEDSALSKGDVAHAMYLVKNSRDAIEHGGLGAEMHTEDPGKPGFTPEGLHAAKSSDMDEWYRPEGSVDAKPALGSVANPGEWTAEHAPGSPEWSIDGWMSLPFHRMPILNPRLVSAGFGMYCEAGACAAGLNLLDGSRRTGPPESNSQSIEFPPDGGTVGLISFGEEWPDPRTSCPGYSAPSGLALTLQLGPWIDTHISSYSLSREYAAGMRSVVEACGIDSSSYKNPDANSQQVGRAVLKDYGTVVLIPRAPLAKGAKYAVSIEANGHQYDWTFATRP